MGPPAEDRRPGSSSQGERGGVGVGHFVAHVVSDLWRADVPDHAFDDLFEDELGSEATPLTGAFEVQP